MTAITIHNDFEAQENKICHCFHFFLIYFPWSDGTECHDLSFWMLSFKQAFSLSYFTFIKRLWFLFTFFAFISVALGDWPKKTLVRFMSENVLPMFSFRSILVSCLLFKPTWVYFCACVWECANFIDLHMAVQFSQCHLLKRLSSIVYSCFL